MADNHKLQLALEAGHKAIIAGSRRAERLLAKRYVEAYNIARTRALDLWATLGDPVTLQEGRKYNRLLTLMDDIKAEYAKVTGYTGRVIAKNSEFAFTEAAYRAQYAIDKATGILISFPKLPVGAIRASVYYADNGAVFSKWLLAGKQTRLRVIEQAITQSLILGESSAKTARRIKDQFEHGYKDAIRVVRTETTRCATQGTLQTFHDADDLGIEMATAWVSIKDPSRTRDSHWDLDGQYADKDGLFHSGGYSSEGPGLWGIAELDINCRCALAAIIEGLEPELRREGGGGIVDNMSYQEWSER